ncbi:hypothetical protein B0H34DRAFT_680041 [Crassisporium funariophilum]|nr:hypothetical protein B0H34DRAFT_680041 [Crassisporium funariophilum]
MAADDAQGMDGKQRRRMTPLELAWDLANAGGWMQIYQQRRTRGRATGHATGRPLKEGLQDGLQDEMTYGTDRSVYRLHDGCGGTDASSWMTFGDGCEGTTLDGRKDLQDCLRIAGGLRKDGLECLRATGRPLKEGGEPTEPDDVWEGKQGNVSGWTAAEGRRQVFTSHRTAAKDGGEPTDLDDVWEGKRGLSTDYRTAAEGWTQVSIGPRTAAKGWSRANGVGCQLGKRNLGGGEPARPVGVSENGTRGPGFRLEDHVG